MSIKATYKGPNQNGLKTNQEYEISLYSPILATFSEENQPLMVCVDELIIVNDYGIKFMPLIPFTPSDWQINDEISSQIVNLLNNLSTLALVTVDKAGGFHFWDVFSDTTLGLREAKKYLNFIKQGIVENNIYNPLFTCILRMRKTVVSAIIDIETPNKSHNEEAKKVS